MDEATAWRIFNEGQPVSLGIEGQHFEGALVTGLNISSGSKTSMDVLLRTRVGEPDKRLRVSLDRVELAP
jgi:hypothetical protein